MLHDFLLDNCYLEACRRKRNTDLIRHPIDLSEYNLSYRFIKDLSFKKKFENNEITRTIMFLKEMMKTMTDKRTLTILE